MNNKHWTLYVLRLEQGKWYVGITSQTVEKRFYEHLHGRKSYWTKQYPPIEIADRKDLGDLSHQDAEEYEKKVVRKYMRAKGINNVRGGDLMDVSNYVVRFGYILDSWAWEAILMVFIFFFIAVALYIDKFIIYFIPGGVR